MPKLSIVVPVYNVEKYLNQCLDSILGQSFSDFELIIIDDGSTDKSGSICDRYAQMDQRVRVIHTENRGVVTARRTGVDHAKGGYTTFVDSDDWLDLDFYRGIFEEKGETDADILICSRVDYGGRRMRSTSFKPGYYGRTELEITVFPRMMYDITTERFHIKPSLWDKVFRTGLLKKVYAGADPAVTLGEDAVCTYPCIAQADSMLILNNSACYHYRQDHVSMVNACDLRLLQRVCSLARNINQQFSEETELFGDQVQHYIAYNSLNAARRVLLFNRELGTKKRIAAVREFFARPEIACSIRRTHGTACSGKLKWKLRFAYKNQPQRLWLLLAVNHAIQKIVRAAGKS